MTINITTIININSNIPILNPILSDITITGLPFLDIAYNNQGKGKPTATSNILLPIDDETAISPFPCLATIILDNISGTLVPAANNVSPIINDGIPIVSPKIDANSTITYDSKPTQTIDMKKEK